MTKLDLLKIKFQALQQFENFEYSNDCDGFIDWLVSQIS